MNVFVARQPIFDRERRVVAYELLYRPGAENSFGSSDPNMASPATVAATLNTFGLENLIGNKLGFYNASRNLLLEENWKLLPPGNTVIEILETVAPDDVVLAACVELKSAGYRLALDDFVFSPEYEALLEHTDYVKIDFMLTGSAERNALAHRFAGQGITMLAEKVETYEEFHDALAAGFNLFQGYFFCKPEMIVTREVAAFKGNMIRLISELNRPDLDFDALENLIKHEVALSVKLLRYLRSAGFGWRHEVDTIGQALRILGEKSTRKWASLVALTIVGEDKPEELVSTSLLLGQFCEEVSGLLPNAGRPGDYFLTGLLSTLEALLDQPIPTLLAQMSLSSEVSGALSGDGSQLMGCLELVKAYIRGDWQKIDDLAPVIGVPTGQLPQAYAKSVAWVNEVYSEQ